MDAVGHYLAKAVETSRLEEVSAQPGAAEAVKVVELEASDAMAEFEGHPPGGLGLDLQIDDAGEDEGVGVTAEVVKERVGLGLTGERDWGGWCLEDCVAAAEQGG